MGRDLQRAVLPCESALPAHFIGAAMLPQSPASILRPVFRTRALREGLRLRRHQSESRPVGRPLDEPTADRQALVPLYEKMVEYDIPTMVHVSTSCNACFHTTGAHYLNADTTAFMQCLTGDLFKDFPTLKFLIPHGGGAVPYHWGRFRGLAQELKKPLLDEHLLNNIFFDTCVYHQPASTCSPR